MNQRERWTRWAGPVLLVALVLGMLVLSGCGGSSGDVSTTAGAGSEATSTTQQSPQTTAAPATTTAQTVATTAPSVSEATEDAGAFEVIAPSGTRSYTLDELKAMTPVIGYWGAHKGDIPYQTNQYKGVALADLLAEAGGLPAGAGLEFNTSDDFPCAYDSIRMAAIANGAYQVWDKLTGEEGTAPVRLIVAYEIDGEPLPASGEGAGPLRLVPALEADTHVTEGKYSPYLLVSVKVVQ
ncbi:MAG: molybdopterin-dependent oxidoreductase [Gaiellales bacterium]|nr:molybdopterin-dependent oxidoreductase [Gaiellales bacterium]